MSEKATTQLSPTECRDFVLGFSKKPSRDTTSEALHLVILDVRTAQEYSSGHLNGAINVDFRSPSFREQIEGMDRNYAYLVYCRTGRRSAQALMLMQSLGFRELYHLTQGIEQWQKEGHDVV
jgi:rhodanese-related sulfurtransferase